MPIVSIIMASYNHERFIPEAIESVLNQTYTDFELIIIDDASKDNSRQIIKDYQNKDDRIKTIFHDKNRGIANTINEGIEQSKGKYMSLISSDDIWQKDKLQKQIEILKKNEDLIVWSEGNIIDANGKLTGETFTQIHNAIKKKKSGNIFEELLKGNFIFDSSLIYKRENVKHIRFNNALKYLCDYQYVVDIAKKYEYFFISEPLVFYRIHGDNTILSDQKAWDNDRIKNNDYFLQKYGDEISDKVKSKIYLRSSRVFSLYGEKAKSIQYIYHAILLNPFNLGNLCYLFFALINKMKLFANIMRRL